MSQVKKVYLDFVFGFLEPIDEVFRVSSPSQRNCKTKDVKV